MKQVLKETITSLSDLQKLGQRLASYLQPGTLFFFNGPLGAGKTSLISALCASRGVRDVSSPTFALHQTYQGPGLQIDHLDLYRLETEEQLESAGIWDLFSEKKSVVLIEWAERVDSGLWPLDWKKYFIQIDYNSENNQRQITVLEQD